MQAVEGMSLEQIQAFLEASEKVEFKTGNKEDLYDWVNQTLRQLDYRKLKRSGRGLVRRYVSKMTGLSRAQATRLLGMYLRGEKVQPKLYRRLRQGPNEPGPQGRRHAPLYRRHGQHRSRLFSRQRRRHAYREHRLDNPDHRRRHRQRHQRPDSRRRGQSLLRRRLYRHFGHPHR